MFGYVPQYCGVQRLSLESVVGTDFLDFKVLAKAAPRGGKRKQQPKEAPSANPGLRDNKANSGFREPQVFAR